MIRTAVNDVVIWCGIGNYSPAAPQHMTSTRESSDAKVKQVLEDSGDGGKGGISTWKRPRGCLDGWSWLVIITAIKM